MSSLSIQIIAGRDLASKDNNGLSDPYCKLYLGDSKGKEITASKRKTEVIKKSLNPEWTSGSFTVDVSEKAQTLFIRCWDKDKMTSDFMGEIAIDLADLEVAPVQGWTTLDQKRNSKKKERISGELNIAVHLLPEGADAPAFQPSQVDVSSSTLQAPEHEAQLVAAQAAEAGPDVPKKQDNASSSDTDAQNSSEEKQRQLEKAAHEAQEIAKSAGAQATDEAKKAADQLEKEAADVAAKAEGAGEEAKREAAAIAAANKEASALIAEEANDAKAAINRKAEKAVDVAKQGAADLERKAAAAKESAEGALSRGLDTATPAKGGNSAVLAGGGLAAVILLLAVLYMFVF